MDQFIHLVHQILHPIGVVAAVGRLAQENAPTPITVHPQTRRECRNTHHGASMNPQGIWAHLSWYVHKTAGNAATPITVRPQNCGEYGHTYHGTSTKPQGMYANLSWYIHKTAGNVGTPILVRPQNPRECGHTHLGTSKSELGFGYSYLGFENAGRF
jgi:hypothetical protein